jgi:2'-5' RNA ligase
VTRRLFFALQPDPDLADALIAGWSPLALQLRGKPVPSSNLHATLTFIGAVPENRVDELRTVARSVRGMPGEIVFDTLEIWEEPRVLVLTAPHHPSLEAAALAMALRDAALAHGFAPDLKNFRPHLTLARKIDLTVARSLPWPRENSPGFVVRFDRFALMESRRGEHGSIYSVVDSWPLYGTGAS